MRDARGFAAAVAPGGARVMPFWSSVERVRRILSTVTDFAGAEPYEMTWETFRDRWLPRCEERGWLAGLNWAGDRALGFDVDPREVRAAVEEAMGALAEAGRVVLETPRLLLREWTPADLPHLPPIYGDPDLTRFVGDGSPRGPAEMSAEIERCRRLYRDRGFGLWAVVLKAGGAVIGHCGLQDLDGGKDVALAYALGRAWRGQGYAIEAALATIRHGFDVLGLTRIVAVTQRVNAASIKVMEKLRMSFSHEAEHYGKQVVVYVIERGA